MKNEFTLEEVIDAVYPAIDKLSEEQPLTVNIAIKQDSIDITIKPYLDTPTTKVVGF